MSEEDDNESGPLLAEALQKDSTDIQRDISALPKNRIRTANVLSSCINLCNTIIGAGVLSLPYALAANGSLFGVMIMAFCGLASGFGLYLLVKCTDFHGKDVLATYYSCAKLAFPKWPWLAFVIDTIVFIKCFGVAVSYLIVIGDVMPDVARYFLEEDGSSDMEESDNILLSRQFWILLFAIFIVPLAFFKRLHQLRFTSLLGLLTILYLFVLVVVYKFYDNETTPDHLETHLFIFSTRFFQVMTIFVFGFTCHQNIFTIYNELLDPTPVRINSVIVISVVTSFVVYCFIGLFGYYTYGTEVADNIMENYPTDVFVTVGRIVVAIHVAVAYPMQSHPSRICMDNLYRVMYKTATKKSATEQTTLRYVTESVLFIIFTWILGLLFEQLDVILALVGALGSTSMVYILPPAFYLKLEGLKPLSPIKVLAIGQFLVGCFVIPTAIAFIFIPDTEAIDDSNSITF